MVTKAVENAQRKVEAHNFEIRKHLIEYDDVMNRQREVIYTQRREVLGGENLKEMVEGVSDETVADMVATFCVDKPAQWQWSELYDDFVNQFNFPPELPEPERADLSQQEMEENLYQQVMAKFNEKEADFSPEVMDHLLKILLL